MTVTSPDLSLSRWLAAADRRRSRARLCQHRIRPRLSLASEPLPRRPGTSSSGCGTRKALPAEEADWLRARVSEARGSCRRSPGAGGRASRGDPRYRRGARTSRQAARSCARQSFRASCAMCRQGRASAWRLRHVAGMERARFAGRGGARARSRSRRSGCSRKAIFTASENAAVTPAAGCSMIAARTTAGGGAKWRSAAIAPSSVDLRRGGVRLERRLASLILIPNLPVHVLTPCICSSPSHFQRRASAAPTGHIAPGGAEA